jgi:hypothetical protein
MQKNGFLKKKPQNKLVTDIFKKATIFIVVAFLIY